jgi:hypothetical protein
VRVVVDAYTIFVGPDTADGRRVILVVQAEEVVATTPSAASVENTMVASGSGILVGKPGKTLAELCVSDIVDG